jgi:hypothetical protein
MAGGGKKMDDEERFPDAGDDDEDLPITTGWRELRRRKRGLL